MIQTASTPAICRDAAATVSAPLSDLDQTGGEGVGHHGQRGPYILVLAQKIFGKGGVDGLR